MRGFELGEKVPRGPSPSFFRILKALPDTFLGVGSGGDIEKVLVSFSILHDGSCFPLHCENHGTLTFLKLLHEIARTTPEGRQRLDILGNIKHWAAPTKAPF